MFEGSLLAMVFALGSAQLQSHCYMVLEIRLYRQTLLNEPISKSADVFAAGTKHRYVPTKA